MQNIPNQAASFIPLFQKMTDSISDHFNRIERVKEAKHVLRRRLKKIKSLTPHAKEFINDIYDVLIQNIVSNKGEHDYALNEITIQFATLGEAKSTCESGAIWNTDSRSCL